MSQTTESRGIGVPNITVEILEGRTLEQKEAFAKTVTQACIDYLDVGAERVRIRFLEVGENEVMVNGSFSPLYRPRAQ
jgi:4-oxalocrotonate tautomerase